MPHTVREWAADTWADAERLEAEIAAGRTFRRSASRQGSSSGPCRLRHRAAAPGHYNLVRLVLCEVPGQLPPGWDAVPRRRPLPQAGELSACAWSPPRAPRVRPVCTTVAGTAVRRLRRWLYIARAVIYLLGRVVSEFLYFAAWAGLAPSPDFAGYRLVWSAAGEKEGLCTPLVLSSDPARP